MQSGSTWANLSDGNGVSGATTATLTLNAVDAADAGQYRVVVTNVAGSTTSTAATLTVTPPGLVVIDDGQSGYSAPGWLEASGPNYAEYYGSDTGYRLGSSGAGPATWTATGLAAGTYRVSVTYTPYPNRATNASYAVKDGSGATLASRVVNQQQAATDLSYGGSQWDDLGTVTVGANGTLVVSLAGQGNGYLIADAARFELVSPPPPPPPPPPPGTVTVIDDGDPGYSAPGWQEAAGSGYAEYYGSDTGYRLGSSSAGSATWTATGLAAGSYRVSVTYTPFSNRATNASYLVQNGSGAVLASRVINQQVGPTDLSYGGSQWDDLVGTVTVGANGTLVVSLAGQGNGYLIADAVRLELVSPPPPPSPVTIIDDGQSGYSAPGWLEASGSNYSQYYGSDTGYVYGPNNAGPATWTATNLAAGTYRVSVTYTADPNRATNAGYAVKDGGGATLASKVVNQQIGPTDRFDAGAWWADLGTVTVSANGTLTVSLSGQGNGYLIADAVRFEKIG